MQGVLFVVCDYLVSLIFGVVSSESIMPLNRYLHNEFVLFILLTLSPLGCSCPVCGAATENGHQLFLLQDALSSRINLPTDKNLESHKTCLVPTYLK